MRGRIESVAPLVAALAITCVFAVLHVPEAVPPGHVAGEIKPDGYDYAYGAQSLLRGSYEVTWDGTRRPPMYPPGTSILLAPSVAVGGVEASVWTVYVLALVLGLLAALLAGKIGHPMAAPLSVALTLLPMGPGTLARTVMSDLPSSDLPSAALVLLQLAALVVRPRARWVIIAGFVSGYLVSLRYSNAGFVLAGIVGLTGWPSWRRNALWYSAAAAVPVLLLLVFHRWAFGSPLATGYITGWSGTLWGAKAQQRSGCRPQLLLA